MSGYKKSQVSPIDDCEVILGNSNKRFSGVTSTMLQTLKHQSKQMKICVLGKHHLPHTYKSQSISFSEAAKRLKHRHHDGKPRIFHARRNDEMIQALILKHVFSADIRILFTSTAQRQHSKFTRWLMSKMDTVISTCNAAAAYLEKPPAAIIPHGIESEIYRPDISRRPENALRIAMFGRVREQKGTHLFVQACIDVFPKYPDTEAIIVGSITPENRLFVEELQARIKQAGLEHRIRFLGEQAFDALPQLFQSASLVAALSRTEGFGLTVLEALSSGAAVLATEAGAWPEIIQNGEHGYIVPVEDQSAITSTLDRLLSDMDALTKMGQSGRQLIEEHYKIELESKRLCDVYTQLRNQPC